MRLSERFSYICSSRNPPCFICFLTLFLFSFSFNFYKLNSFISEKVLKWSIELWKLVREMSGSYFRDLATMSLHRISIALNLASLSFFSFSFYSFSNCFFSSYFFAFFSINFCISANFFLDVRIW